MKPTPRPKSQRKKIKPISKAVYREHQLMERLLRYTDHERVLKVLDVNAIEDLPNEFFAKGDGYTVSRVTVNWLGIRAGLESTIDVLSKSGPLKLKADDLVKVKRFQSTRAVLHVLEFLPEVIDAAISNLYVEALMRRPADLGRDWVSPIAKTLSGKDYDERLRRLGIQEGPKPRFLHRSQYESALRKAIKDLIVEERQITQESVADKLTGESDVHVDVRMIRRWNKDFGVSWIDFVKRSTTADKSS